MMNSLYGHLFDRDRMVPALIVAVSLGALGTALASEYWGGLHPCILCMYQRYAYAVVVAFGLVGFIFHGDPATRRAAVALAGLAFLAGSVIAGFHVGVEQHWWQGTAACHVQALDPALTVAQLRQQLAETTFVPCDQIAWSMFGISMAGYNAIFSLGFAGFALAAAARGSRPVISGPAA